MGVCAGLPGRLDGNGNRLYVRLGCLLAGHELSATVCAFWSTADRIGTDVRASSDRLPFLQEYAGHGLAVSLYSAMDHVDFWQLWRHEHMGTGEANRAVSLVDPLCRGGRLGDLSRPAA